MPKHGLGNAVVKPVSDKVLDLTSPPCTIMSNVLSVGACPRRWLHSILEGDGGLFILSLQHRGLPRGESLLLHLGINAFYLAEPQKCIATHDHHDYQTHNCHLRMNMILFLNDFHCFTPHNSNTWTISIRNTRNYQCLNNNELSAKKLAHIFTIFMGVSVKGAIFLVRH